jgi:hypothetical protein
LGVGIADLGFNSEQTTIRNHITHPLSQAVLIC